MKTRADDGAYPETAGSTSGTVPVKTVLQKSLEITEEADLALRNRWPGLNKDAPKKRHRLWWCFPGWCY